MIQVSSMIQVRTATYNADGCVSDSRDIIVVIEIFQRNVIVVFTVAFDHITTVSNVVRV